MARKFFVGLVTAGIVGLAAAPAQAQSTVNASATIPIGTVLYIAATNPNVVFAAPTAADFDAGFIDATTVTNITHNANVRHSVTVAATSPTMTATAGGAGADGARADKPASDLQWSRTGSAFTGLTPSATPIRSGVARGAYSDLDIRYRMALDYDEDTPGTYGLNFVYTIVAD